MTIFFDYDGTLSNPWRRHYHVYETVVNEFSGVPIDVDKYFNLKREKVTWETILPMSGIHASKKDKFLDKFIKLIESDKNLALDELYEGAKQLITNLASDPSINLYLVSLRRNDAHLKQQLQNEGLSDYFKEILSGHSESDGSDIKLDIVQKYRNGPSIIIGDTEADVLTAKKAGIPIVALDHGMRSRQYLQKLDPNYIVSDLRSVQAVIKDMIYSS